MVSKDGLEAEVWYKPGLIARLFGFRRSYSPIIRTSGGMWLHKYTGRPVNGEVLCLLESLPGDHTARMELLEAVSEVTES